MKTRLISWLLLTLIVLLILLVLGIQFGPVVFIMYLAAGWIGYLRRVLPDVQIVWPAVLTAAVCLAGVLILGHALASWLYREAAPAGLPARRWKPRWTATAAALLVLMFASGIAAVGVTHQSAWLARSDKPMFHYGGRSRETANRVKCASNMRYIGQAILLYAQDHQGHFPDTLEEILLTQDITAEVFTCPSANDDRAPGDTPQQQARHLRDHCSYVYHGKGLTTATPGATTRPVLCEPLMNHKVDGMNVLYADGHAEFLTPAEAQKALGTHRH